MVNQHLPGPFRIRHIRALEEEKEEIFPYERDICFSTGMGKRSPEPVRIKREAGW